MTNLHDVDTGGKENLPPLHKPAESDPTMPVSKSVRDTAVSYGRGGKPVFPCDPSSKRPMIQGGFKNASTEFNTVHGFWRQFPSAMIGMPMGEVSGIVALDIDVDPAKGINGEASLAELIEKHGPLPGTVVQITPRGGRHFLFKHPGVKVKNSASGLGKGIDIRGDGGYICITPSVNAEGKAYRWAPGHGIKHPLAEMPEWLLNLVREKEHAAPVAGEPSNVVPLTLRSGNTPYVTAAFKKEIEKLKESGPGQRNNVLNTVSFAIGTFIGAGALDRTEAEAAIREACVENGLMENPDEVERTMDSGITAGMKKPRELPEPKQKAGNAFDEVPLWYSKALTGAKGQVLSCVANVLLALRLDPAFTGVFTYDTLADRVVVNKPIPRHGKNAPPGVFEVRGMMDADAIAVQEWLQIAGLPGVGKDSCFDAIDTVAREHPFNPVSDYINGLNWDGVSRVGKWLTTYAGAEASEYTSAIGKMYLIGMVARALDPGCKMDYLIVLEGKQGARKSTLCRTLAGDTWFSDNMPADVTHKDAAQHLKGKWLIELAEMHAVNKNEDTALKAFIGRTEDKYRPSYGRKDVEIKRGCVFMGTTNKNEYLKDETGARRYWPVKVKMADIDALIRDRDQLFAEAAFLWLDGEPFHPTKEFEDKHIKPQQAARRIADFWEEDVARYLAGEIAPRGVADAFDRPEDRTVAERDKQVPLTRVTLTQVAREALGFDATNRVGTSDQNKLARVMEALGWTRCPEPFDGRNRWWIPSENA